MAAILEDELLRRVINV